MFMNLRIQELIRQNNWLIVQYVISKGIIFSRRLIKDSERVNRFDMFLLLTDYVFCFANIEI